MNPILEHGPRLRRAVLLVGAIGTPLFFLRIIEDPFNLPKLSLLTMVVTVALAIRIAEALQGSTPSEAKRLWIPAAAIAAPISLSWLFNDRRAWAWFGEYARYQGLFPYLLVVLFGLLLVDAFSGRARTLGWAMTVGGGAVGGYAALQWIGGDPFVWAVGGQQSRQALSTIGNPNFASAFIGICLPVMIAVWSEERVRRATALRLIVLAVVGLVLTFSQGGWAGGIAGTAIVLGYREALRRPRARTAGLLIAGLVAMGAFGAVVFAIAKPDTTLLPYTVAYRGQWWIEAVEMTFDSPVIGSGPNAFALEGTKYRTDLDAALNRYDFADDPHSIYLQFAANSGLLGLIGFLGVAAWVLLRVPRAGSSLLHVGFWAAAVAYFVQALVSIDELSVRTALWIALAGIAATEVAEVARTSSKPSKKKTTSRRNRVRAPLRSLPAVVVVAVLGLVALWWPLKWVLADVSVHSGMDAFNRTEPGQAMDHFESALALRDLPHYRLQYGSKLGEAAANQEESSDAGEPYYEAMPEQFSYLEDVPQLFGYINQARYQYAWWSETEDENALERSAELWASALEIDPRNPLLRAEMAEVLGNLDREQQALDVLGPAIEVMELGSHPDYARVWAAVARSRLALGDTDGARQAVERALVYDPEFEGALQVQSALAGSG